MTEPEGVAPSPIRPEADALNAWRLRAQIAEAALGAGSEAVFWRHALKALHTEFGAQQVVVWDFNQATNQPQVRSKYPERPVAGVPPGVLKEALAAEVSCSAALPSARGTLKPCLLGKVTVSGSKVGILQVVLLASSLKPGLTTFLDQALQSLSVALTHLRGTQSLRHEAEHDPLTNLPNRRALQRYLNREIKLATRHGLPLSLVLIDLDHFKQFNDTHGHAAGDRLLVAAAETLRQLSRSTDCVARYGGEEFVVVLPHTDRPGARAFAEKLLEGIRSLSDTPVSRQAPLSASLGTATWPQDVREAQRILAAADAAMYEAKAQGRNRVAQAGR